MENLKKIAPLLVLGLLVLAACTNPLAKKTTEEAGGVEKPTGSVAVEETTIGTTAPELRYDSGIKCSDLKVASNRQACEQQVNDLVGGMLESEIIGTFDVKRCKELPAELTEQCESQITDSGIQGPVSSKDLAIFIEALHGTVLEPGEEVGELPPAPVYDKGKCAQLTTPGYKEYCEEQVGFQMDQAKLDEIISSDDVDRCDELETEDMMMNCKFFFGVEPEVVEAPTPVPPTPEATEESSVVAQ